MRTIKLTGEIVGGPHDGKWITYEGTSEHDDVLEKMDKVEFDGHVYKIVEFDRATMRVLLLW